MPRLLGVGHNKNSRPSAVYSMFIAAISPFDRRWEVISTKTAQVNLSIHCNRAEQPWFGEQRAERCMAAEKELTRN